MIKKILAAVLALMISSVVVAQTPPAELPKVPSDHQPVFQSHRRSQSFGEIDIFNPTQTTWSGYVKHSGTYSQVSARWKVPTLTWGSTSYNPFGFEYETTWVGIGGFGEGTLIQFGTESIVNASNVQTNFTWYELIPAVSVNIGLATSPGDVITADMHCTANCTPGSTQTWLLTLNDVTKGTSWSNSFSYASSMASAEWILEAPFSGNWLPLPNFGSQNFDTARANSVNQSLDLTADGLYLYDSPGDQTAYPSAVTGGDSFSVCYGFLTYTNPCPFTPLDPLPTAILTTSPSVLSPSRSTTITWSSTLATSCTGSGFSTGGATSGSTSVKIMATTAFGLSCTGTSGTATTSASAVSMGGGCVRHKCRGP